MKKKRLIIKQTNPLGVLLLILFALAFIVGIVLLSISLLARYSNAKETLFQNRSSILDAKHDTETAIFNCIAPYHSIPKRFPKNLQHLSIQKRKKLFIHTMLPIAFKVKSEFDKEHSLIENIKTKLEKGLKLTDYEKKELKQSMKRYKTQNIYELVKRADSVPVSIIIAQAGIESGWGSSRFSKIYNNPYGLHRKYVKPYKPIVRSFKSLYDATVAYVMNINTSFAYEKFRNARYMMQKMRNPYKLAEYLSMYSTKREQYTLLIQKVISSNALFLYDMYDLHRIMNIQCQR